MRRFGFCLAFINLFACILHANPVYKVVNSDGSVTYSDTPRPGSVVVSLPSSANNVIRSTTNVSPNYNTPPKATSPPVIAIVSPQHEQTIRDNNGNVVVEGMTDTPFSGHFTLVMDGKEIAHRSTPTFALKDIDRGTHKIKIQLKDKSGKILASSIEQTFFLHRASAFINAN